MPTEFVHVSAENRGGHVSLQMSALIYTQLGVSPDIQKQTGFAGYQSKKGLGFSHITAYKESFQSWRVETAAQQAL